METAGQFTGAPGASITDYSKGCCWDGNSQESAVPSPRVRFFPAHNAKSGSRQVRLIEFQFQCGGILKKQHLVCSRPDWCGVPGIRRFRRPGTNLLVHTKTWQLRYICASIKIVPSSQAGTWQTSWAWWKLKCAGDERRRVGWRRGPMMAGEGREVTRGILFFWLSILTWYSGEIIPDLYWAWLVMVSLEFADFELHKPLFCYPSNKYWDSSSFGPKVILWRMPSYEGSSIEHYLCFISYALWTLFLGNKYNLSSPPAERYTIYQVIPRVTQQVTHTNHTQYQMNSFCFFTTVCLLQSFDSFWIGMSIRFRPVLRVDYSDSFILWAVGDIPR